VRDAKGASFTCVDRRRYGVKGAERGRGFGPWIVHINLGVEVDGRKCAVGGDDEEEEGVEESSR